MIKYRIDFTPYKDGEDWAYSLDSLYKIVKEDYALYSELQDLVIKLTEKINENTRSI